MKLQSFFVAFSLAGLAATQQVPTTQAQTTRSINKTEILTAHNNYRSQVGVPPLQWSDTLASSAQKWANQLAATRTFRHSKTQGVGENLWSGTAGAFTFVQMVNSWGSEKKYFKYGVFPDVSTTGNWVNVGHYTQMVWRNTKLVGCGIATGKGNDYLVCHYSPQGNYIKQKVY